MGSLDSAEVAVPNIFKTAIMENAAAVIGLHNHPSGSIKPSQADIDVTKRLAAAGKLLGIKLLDHIIVGAYSGMQYSFKQEKPELFEPRLISYDSLSNAAINNMKTLKPLSREEDFTEDYDEEMDI